MHGDIDPGAILALGTCLAVVDEATDVYGEDVRGVDNVFGLSNSTGWLDADGALASVVVEGFRGVDEGGESSFGIAAGGQVDFERRFV